MSSAGDAEMKEEGAPVDINSMKCVLQVEQEQIQNRTFTKWVNAQLAKHKTPSVVQDLFRDLRDGQRLLDLLEVLSGQRLDRESGGSTQIHWRTNIRTALQFIRTKSIKLVNINVPDIVEGKPTIVLGLIWSIILHLHIQKLAGVELSHRLDSSPTATSPGRRKPSLHAKEALLQWVQEKAKRVGVNVGNFSTSWRSGRAFVAIINALRPGLIDLQEFEHRSDKENLETVFRVAEQELKIPRLLEAQDVDVRNPDEKSMIIYVAQFLQYSRDHPMPVDGAEGPTQSPPLVGTEALVSRPDGAGDHHVSKAEVKRDFEEARGRIEAGIQETVLLLSERGTLEELVAKHQEMFKNFDSGLLANFLEATDKIKAILAPQKSQLVEEMREEICQKWEMAQSAVRSHLHMLKFTMEQNKFNGAFQECEIQLGKESCLLQSGPAELLEWEHQMSLREGSSLIRAQQHLAAMRQLCESWTDDRDDAKTKAQLLANEHRLTELEERVSRRLSRLRDSAGSHVAGELRTECPTGEDQGEAGTREGSAERVGRSLNGEDQGNDLGSEDSAQSAVTKEDGAGSPVREDSAEFRVADPSGKFQAGERPGEIPGQSTELIAIGNDVLEREGPAQSAEEPPTRKVQSDGLEREDSTQSVTCCPIGEEPLGGVVGECPAQPGSVPQSVEDMASLLRQPLTGKDQVDDQAWNSYAQLVEVSPRGPVVGLPTKDSAQQAKEPLTVKIEVARFPRLDDTRLAKVPLSGQDQGDVLARHESAPLALLPPREQHQGALQAREGSAQLQKESSVRRDQVFGRRKEEAVQVPAVALSEQQQAEHRGTEGSAQMGKEALTGEECLTGKDQDEGSTLCEEGSLSGDDQNDSPIGQDSVQFTAANQGQSDQTDNQERLSGEDQGEDLTQSEEGSLTGEDQGEDLTLSEEGSLTGEDQGEDLTQSEEGSLTGEDQGEDLTQSEEGSLTGEDQGEDLTQSEEGSLTGEDQGEDLTLSEEGSLTGEDQGEDLTQSEEGSLTGTDQGEDLTQSEEGSLTGEDQGEDLTLSEEGSLTGEDQGEDLTLSEEGSLTGEDQGEDLTQSEEGSLTGTDQGEDLTQSEEGSLTGEDQGEDLTQSEEGSLTGTDQGEDLTQSEEGSLTGEDQGEDLTLSEEGSLTGEDQGEDLTLSEEGSLTGTDQGEDLTLSEEGSLIGEDQGEDLTQSEEVSLTGTNQTNTPGTGDSVRSAAVMLSEEEQADGPVREECAQSAKEGLTGKDQAYGLAGENSDQLPVGEQSLVPTQAAGNSVQFLSGRAQDHGLTRQDPPPLVGASLSEQHQAQTREVSAQYLPMFVSEQKEAGGPATQDTAQITKQCLIGIEQAYGLPGEDARKLPAVSLSETESTKDQASTGSTRLVKLSPIGGDQVDSQTTEDSVRWSGLFPRGDVQACGLPGEDSEWLISESPIGQKAADDDLTRGDSAQSERESLTGKDQKGREREGISPSVEELPAGKGQASGPPGVELTENRAASLREREQADSPNTKDSVPLAAVILSGQPQDYGLPREGSPHLAEEPVSEIGQADGLVRKDSAGAAKEPLSGDDQNDSPTGENSVQFAAANQGQTDQTDNQERLSGEDQGEDLTQSEEVSLTGTDQGEDLTQSEEVSLIGEDQGEDLTQSEEVSLTGTNQTNTPGTGDSVRSAAVMLSEEEQADGPVREECAQSAKEGLTGKDQAYGLPGENSDQLPVGEQSLVPTQAAGNSVQFLSGRAQDYGLTRQDPPPLVGASLSEQHQAQTREVSAQYLPMFVSEQKEAGRAATQNVLAQGPYLSEEEALSGESLTDTQTTENPVQWAEVFLHEPDRAGVRDSEKSGQPLKESLIWEEQAREDIAEAEPGPQRAEDQADDLGRDNLPRRIFVPRSDQEGCAVKPRKGSARSANNPSNGEDEAAVSRSGLGQGDSLARGDADLLVMEPLTAMEWSGLDASQLVKGSLEASNLAVGLAVEISGKSAPTTDQKLAGIPNLGSVDLGETEQQDKETQEEEDQSTTDDEEKEGSLDAVNEISKRYKTAKETFETRLKRMESLIRTDPHCQPTMSGLREKLQEVQAAQTEVTSHLSQFDAVAMELQRLPEDTRTSDINRLRGESTQLQQALHCREESLRTALTALETTEEQITPLHNSLLQFQSEPKTLSGLSLKQEPHLQMLKNLQTQTKSQIETCEGLQSGENEATIRLDLGDRDAVRAVALGHARRCREIGSRARDAEEALGALDGFLRLLRAVDPEGEGTVRALKGRSEEEAEARSLQDRALELDETLNAAKIRLESGSSGERTWCRDLAVSLCRRAEGAGLGRRGQEHTAQEDLRKAFCARQSDLIKDLQEIEKCAGGARLNEATLPAVQHRLRYLNDLDTELQSKTTELDGLRELMEHLFTVSPALGGEAREGLHATEKVWEETKRNIHDWQDQCCVLVAFLREFQNFKKDLTTSIQKGEDAIPGHSPYMGKEKLQSLMNKDNPLIPGMNLVNLRCTASKVDEVKLELSNQQEKVDEMRNICRHLQSELRKITDCGTLPFQGEADELVDQWLDVTEKLDSYSSSLKQALSLWEDLTQTGERGKRTTDTPGESLSGPEPALLEDEIQFQEREIRSFHEKATRIQELLEWEEVPLELQVVETAVRKKMEKINSTKSQLAELSTGEEELRGALGEPRASLEATEASFTSLSGASNPRIRCDLQGGFPAADSRVRGQPRAQRSPGEREELVWGGEDPAAPSDAEVKPTADGLPQLSKVQRNQTELEILQTSINVKLSEAERQIRLLWDLPSALNTLTVQRQLEELEALRAELECSRELSSDGQRPGDSDLRRRRLGAIEEVTDAKRHRESQQLQVEGYQSKLSAAQSLLGSLVADQENLERGAVESSISHLEKAQSLAGNLEKEKMVLGELEELGDKVSEHLNEMDRALLRRQLEGLNRDWLRLEQNLKRNLRSLTAEAEDFDRHLTSLRELESWAKSQGSAERQEEGPRPALTPDLEGRRAALRWRQREVERFVQTARGSREKEVLAEAVRRAQSALTSTDHAFPEGVGTEEARLLSGIKGALTWLKKTDGQLAAAEKVALSPEDLKAQVEGHQALHGDIAGRLPAIEAFSTRAGALLLGMSRPQAAEADSLLAALRGAGAELARKSASRLRRLTTALPRREKMAAGAEELARWLEKVEGAAASGVQRRDSGPHLEDQSALHRLPEQKELLESVLQEAAEAFPALTNSERSLLSSQLKFLERRFSRSTALARDRGRRAEKELRERSEISAPADAFQREAKEFQRRLSETVTGGERQEIAARVAGLQAEFGRLQERSEAPGRGGERLEGLRAEVKGRAHEELERLAKDPEAAEQPRRVVADGKAKREAVSEDRCDTEGRYVEKQREYMTDCRQLSNRLDALETALRASASQTPSSYKAAIEQAERQRVLGGDIDSIKRKMTDLRDRAVDLERTGEAGGGACASRAVSRVWDHWLCLQDSAKEQELYSRDLKEEWKTISEQIDRATIVLDHLQDALPEGPSEQATKAELLELEEYVSHYDDDLRHQQSSLAVLVRRVTGVLAVRDASDRIPAAPVLQELRAMEDRCRSLAVKIDRSRGGVEEEEGVKIDRSRGGVEEEEEGVKIDRSRGGVEEEEGVKIDRSRGGVEEEEEGVKIDRSRGGVEEEEGVKIDTSRGGVEEEEGVKIDRSRRGVEEEEGVKIDRSRGGVEEEEGVKIDRSRGGVEEEEGVKIDTSRGGVEEEEEGVKIDRSRGGVEEEEGVKIDRSRGGVEEEEEGVKIDRSRGGVEEEEEGVKIDTSRGGVEEEEGVKIDRSRGGVEEEEGVKIDRSRGGVEEEEEGVKIDRSRGGVEEEEEGVKINRSRGGVEEEEEGVKIDRSRGGVEEEEEGVKIDRSRGGVEEEEEGVKIDRSRGGVEEEEGVKIDRSRGGVEEEEGVKIDTSRGGVEEEEEGVKIDRSRGGVEEEEGVKIDTSRRGVEEEEGVKIDRSRGGVEEEEEGVKIDTSRGGVEEEEGVKIDRSRGGVEEEEGVKIDRSRGGVEEEEEGVKIDTSRGGVEEEEGWRRRRE
ncbi:nesprin-2-like [Heptranchias perlo]|uniref:nesprin-2-like n=1 Tax=Heptranchias perlo TaxID=212740 RepID=UPI0035597D7C